MDLWIRSQSKKRIKKVKDIYYQKIGEEFCVVDDDIVFGKYKSSERALEVLDEIQYLLQPKVYVNEDVFIPNKEITSSGMFVKNKPEIEYYNVPIIYEMPKE